MQRHDDLAAHLKIAVQAQPLRSRGIHTAGNGLNGGHVGGHVLAVYAVAARDGESKPPLIVVQGHAQAVVFVLDDVFDLLPAGSFARAAVESVQFLEGERVIQAQHRRDVPARLEAFAGRSAHALRGRVRRDQFRVCGLELLQLVHQPVEFGIGNRRAVEQVIAMLVQADLFPQFGDPPEEFTIVELAVVFGLGHDAAGPYRRALNSRGKFLLYKNEFSRAAYQAFSRGAPRIITLAIQ